MNYIKKKDKFTIIDGKIIERGIRPIIEGVALKNFKSIDSIKRSTRLSLGINRNIPLYIDDDILLVPLSGLRSNDVFFYNHMNVEDILIEDNYSTIFFKNKEMIKIDVSKYRMKESMNKAKKIVEYLKLKNNIN